MYGTAKPQPRIVTPALVPVGPSLLVRVVLTPMTRVLNPIIGKLAGRRHFPIAQIHHVGRRTGISHSSPVGARLRSGVVLIPLTFGNQSDWARNVNAAGGCSIQINGATYDVVGPRFLTAADVASAARASFLPVERFTFKVLGIKQFMRLELPAHQQGEVSHENASRN